MGSTIYQNPKVLLLLGLKTFELIKAVSDTVFDMINDVYHDKPLMFIRATFREKLVSHHQAVNVKC